jgi:hypothetical protein
MAWFRQVDAPTLRATLLIISHLLIQSLLLHSANRPKWSFGRRWRLVRRKLIPTHHSGSIALEIYYVCLAFVYSFQTMVAILHFRIAARRHCSLYRKHFAGVTVWQGIISANEVPFPSPVIYDDGAKPSFSFPISRSRILILHLRIGPLRPDFEEIWWPWKNVQTQ